MITSSLNEATSGTAAACGSRVLQFLEHFRSSQFSQTWESWAPGDSHSYLTKLHADLVALELVLEARMRELGIEGYQ